MKKHDLPAMPFYWGDWFKAPDVQALKPRDKCLWFEMLGRMWESKERGYLMVGNRPPDEEETARLFGYTSGVAELRESLAELERMGIFSRRDKDGAIYCRRMIRDEQKRKQMAKIGRKGGNPKLRGNYNEPGFVYVIGDGAGAFKIGISKNPAKRLYDIKSQTGNGNLRVFRQVPVEDMGTSERNVHEELSEHKDGEWFATSITSIDNVLQRILQDNGSD